MSPSYTRARNRWINHRVGAFSRVMRRLAQSTLAKMTFDPARDAPADPRDGGCRYRFYRRGLRCCCRVMTARPASGRILSGKLQILGMGNRFILAQVPAGPSCRPDLPHAVRPDLLRRPEPGRDRGAGSRGAGRQAERRAGAQAAHDAAGRFRHVRAGSEKLSPKRATASCSNSTRNFGAVDRVEIKRDVFNHAQRARPSGCRTIPPCASRAGIYLTSMEAPRASPGHG